MSRELTEAQWTALMAVVEWTEAQERWRTIVQGPRGLVLEEGPRGWTFRNGNGGTKTRVRVQSPQRRAWLHLRDLEARGHDRQTIEGLATTEPAWLRTWRRSDGTAITLTPWAAERLGVEIAEHREVGHDDEEGEGGPPRPHSGLSDEPHWTTRWPERDVDGRPLKARIQPVHIPRQRGLVSLSDGMRDVPSRDKGPVEQAIEDEEWAMQVAVKDDGRLDVDEETGKVKRVPIRVLPRYARDQGKMKIDRRLVRKRPGPKRARADR